MATLYIDRKDIELRVSSGVLEFYELSGKRGSVPLAHLERVVLRGRARLTTSVLGAIADAGAGMLVLSGRQNRHLATCVGRPHNEVLRRLGQFDAFRDPETRLRWSRELVTAKIKAQLRLLCKARARRPDKRRPLTRAIHRLERLFAQVSDAPGPANIACLLGMEGAAASAYFEGFRALFARSLGFEGRRRRPPRDPVNACLSLGYTLLHFEAVATCHSVGLDPLLGLYHEPAFGRESLAADAIEPFRPYVDEWVWTMFRERTLTADGFRKDKEAVLLDKNARQRFYERFQPLSMALRRLLRRQLSTVAHEMRRRGNGILPDMTIAPVSL